MMNVVPYFLTFVAAINTYSLSKLYNYSLNTKDLANQNVLKLLQPFSKYMALQINPLELCDLFIYLLLPIVCTAAVSKKSKVYIVCKSN